MDDAPQSVHDADADPGAAKTPASPREVPEREEVPGQRDTVTEIGGPKGLEPTRYGDWERKGRCIDF
jgi:hypothetical protein